MRGHAHWQLVVLYIITSPCILYYYLYIRKAPCPQAAGVQGPLFSDLSSGSGRHVLLLFKILHRHSVQSATIPGTIQALMTASCACRRDEDGETKFQTVFWVVPVGVGRTRFLLGTVSNVAAPRAAAAVLVLRFLDEVRLPMPHTFYIYVFPAARFPCHTRSLNILCIETIRKHAGIGHLLAERRTPLTRQRRNSSPPAADVVQEGLFT